MSMLSNHFCSLSFSSLKSNILHHDFTTRVIEICRSCGATSADLLCVTSTPVCRDFLPIGGGIRRRHLDRRTLVIHTSGSSNPHIRIIICTSGPWSTTHPDPGHPHPCSSNPHTQILFHIYEYSAFSLEFCHFAFKVVNDHWLLPST